MFALALSLAALITGAQAAAVGCVDAKPGQVISYQGSEPVALDYVETPTYYYKWSAEVDGSEMASGVDKDFNFTTPDISSEEGMKTVIVTLLVTDGYGCIGETTQCLSVYAVPTCGIGGPDSVCQESPKKEFYYSGEDTSKATFAFTWSIDNKKVGSGESINIDWTSYKFGDHTLTLKVDKTYEGGMTVTTSCEKSVKYVESPVATFKMVGAE